MHAPELYILNDGSENFHFEQMLNGLTPKLYLQERLSRDCTKHENTFKVIYKIDKYNEKRHEKDQ
jgi:hypothetical protein